MLIDRNNAIFAIQSEMAALPASDHDRPVNYVRDGLTRAIGVLLALPAIGTCKDCAEWTLSVASHGWGDCCSTAEAYGPNTGVVETLPDHFCSAWRAKPCAAILAAKE